MDSCTNNNSRDTLNYKGHSFSVSRRLREYYVYHTGYDITPANVLQSLINWCKDEGTNPKEMIESEEVLSNAVETYMRVKVKGYRQEFDWNEDKAEVLPDTDLSRIYQYIEEDQAKWQ